MSTMKITTNTKVKNANARLATTAKAIHAKALASQRQSFKPKTTNGKKITHSYRLYSLLKKQKGTATTAQLAAATGLPPSYVAWYMAELKRVYGVRLHHKWGDKLWKATGLSSVTVPPEGIAGRRRTEDLPTTSAPTQQDVAGVIAAMKKGLQRLESLRQR